MPDIYYFDFDRENLQKPWEDPNAKLDDYFNHGFDEEIFKHYQAKMWQNNEKYGKNILEEEELMEKLPPRDLGKEPTPADKHNSGDDINMYHWPLNFVLPHELGGCGLPHF